MTELSASTSVCGKGFPLLCARLRIPRHALALKKYLGCTPPVGSKTSDNEHTAAPLGHSEELRVQNSPGESVSLATRTPELGQLSE